MKATLWCHTHHGGTATTSISPGLTLPVLGSALGRRMVLLQHNRRTPKGQNFLNSSFELETCKKGWTVRARFNLTSIRYYNTFFISYELNY